MLLPSALRGRQAVRAKPVGGVLALAGGESGRAHTNGAKCTHAHRDRRRLSAAADKPSKLDKLLLVQSASRDLLPTWQANRSEQQVALAERVKGDRAREERKRFSQKCVCFARLGEPLD